MITVKTIENSAKTPPSLNSQFFFYAGCSWRFGALRKTSSRQAFYAIIFTFCKNSSYDLHMWRQYCLRTFQQTPETDPRYPKIQIWKDFLYKWLVEGLGYVRGVCRSFLRYCHLLEYIPSLAYLDHPGPSILPSRWRPFCLDQFLRVQLPLGCVKTAFVTQGLGSREFVKWVYAGLIRHAFLDTL